RVQPVDVQGHFLVLDRLAALQRLAVVGPEPGGDVGGGEVQGGPAGGPLGGPGQTPGGRGGGWQGGALPVLPGAAGGGGGGGGLARMWGRRASLWRNASSARLRGVMSLIWATPCRGRPSASRTTEALSETQISCPCLWRYRLSIW